MPQVQLKRNVRVPLPRSKAEQILTSRYRKQVIEPLVKISIVRTSLLSVRGP